MASILQRLSRPFTSSTLRFGSESSARVPQANEQIATVAAGCFWGVEHMYAKDFKNKGVVHTEVGYIGGNTDNPSYFEVCNRQTGHAEALRIFFDPDVVSYRTLIEYFYKMHDPKTLNSQGPDKGTQYRSAIFYENEEQKQTAEDVTSKANQQWWDGKIKTKVEPATSWFKAEPEHQEYLKNNPSGYECPSHFLRNFPALK